MTTRTSTLRESGKRGIAKVFGVLFICAALFASALSLGLPHRSSAASNEVTLTPVADTFVSSRYPTRTSGSSSRLEVRSEPTTRAFLRFEVQGLGQASVTNAHLRLFAMSGSQGQPVALQLFATPASWDEQAVNWNQQPAMGQPIAQTAPTLIEKDQWIDIDLGQTIGGDGMYSFVLTTDSIQRLNFRSSARTNAPQLALTIQGDAGPVSGAETAPTAAPATGDGTDEADTAPTDTVDAATAAADAAEPTPDADMGIPGTSLGTTEPLAAPQVDNAPSLAAPQALAAATANPMGCRAGEIFTDMQDWWTNPTPSKNHGHLHISVCFPHGQTLTGKVTFRVRSVLHTNPGKIVRIGIYTTTPNVAGAVTCGGNGALACAAGLPRTLVRCTATGGTLSPDGMTCTWWDTLIVNTASVANDGWQEFRFKGYVDEPDGKQMIVSNGLYAYLKNGHAVKNVVLSGDGMIARGWYTGAGYTNVDMVSPPTKPVSGIWKPYVKFSAPSGSPITGYYAALDTDFHNKNPGIPIKSGTAAWKGNLSIDTTKLSNGWHRLFLKADSYISASGSTNSGVLAILFEVNNAGSALNGISSPAAFETPIQTAAMLICKPDQQTIASVIPLSTQTSRA